MDTIILVIDYHLTVDIQEDAFKFIEDVSDQIVVP